MVEVQERTTNYIQVKSHKRSSTTETIMRNGFMQYYRAEVEENWDSD